MTSVRNRTALASFAQLSLAQLCVGFGERSAVGHGLRFFGRLDDCAPVGAQIDGPNHALAVITVSC